MGEPPCFGPRPNRRRIGQFQPLPQPRQVHTDRSLHDHQTLSHRALRQPLDLKRQKFALARRYGRVGKGFAQAARVRLGSARELLEAVRELLRHRYGVVGMIENDGAPWRISVPAKIDKAERGAERIGDCNHGEPVLLCHGEHSWRIRDLNNDGDDLGSRIQQPAAFWQPALSALAARHGIPDGPWERASLGRNVVFLGPGVVFKLGPPCWAGGIEREAHALAAVAGRLPVRTPTVRAVGQLEQWEYLLTERLAGVNLLTLWEQLPPAERVELAAQHGRLMAAVHAIPVADLPASLQFDWAAMLAEQRAAVTAALAQSGLDDALLQQVPAYLAAWDEVRAPVARTVLVHGDLTHLNLLVEPAGERWAITGLLDWGDVKVGPWTHELLSPGVHMYRGDQAALSAWYAGYGQLPSERRAAVAHEATARAVLYYANMFASILKRLPGGEACRNWPCVARCLWQLE